MRHTLAQTALLFLAAATLLAADPDWTCDFEQGLDGWYMDEPGKQMLLSRSDHARSGSTSAYSGPPGNMRVARHDFSPPLTGRVEIYFYDDLGKGKQQMAGVIGQHEDLLAIITRDDNVYEFRIGKTYTRTEVKRARGWHLFAWECDGMATTAYVDENEVAKNDSLGRIDSLIAGSFWNASTGWYDDAKAWRRPPTKAPAFVEAEAFLTEAGPESAAVEIVAKRGASQRAFRNWDKPGHRLQWSLWSSGKASQVLIRYATRTRAIRRIEIDEHSFEHTFEATGDWDAWRLAAIPLDLPEGVHTLTMTNLKGSLNLDWIALAEAQNDPQQYGKDLHAFVTSRERRQRAVTMTEHAAREAGVDINLTPASAHALTPLPSASQLQQWLADGPKPLQQARQDVLAALEPKLNTAFKAQRWPLEGQDTDLTETYFRRLENYLKWTVPRFRDWPYHDQCRYHKREGSREWDVRQNATVALGYAVLLRGPYDQNRTQIPRTDLQSDLIQLLRTLAITHRVNFLPTSDGKPWGDQWQSAFWAALAGQAAWLVWDRLPPDVQIMIARLVEHEADRFNERRPDSGYRGDTKAEENAWNSEVIALAACMFPGHPRAELWHERAIVYMLNSFVRKQDLNSNRVVDGKPLGDRLSAVTLHDDFTLENHHRVHPDYMGTTGLLLRNMPLYKAAGLPIPEAATFNVPEMFEVFKGLAATNGSCLYVNGQDWWPHRHDVVLFNGGAMAALAGDPFGGFLERATLETFAIMHSRFDDGAAWHPREYNYANAEEEMIARYAQLYLMHRMFGDGPAPATKKQFLQNRAGVRLYDVGGFVTHSTLDKFVSFAWTNGAMGLIFPSDDTWFTAPYERGLVGSIRCREKSDTTPTVQWKQVAEMPGGVTLQAHISRCENSITQKMALISLPDSPVLYVETLSANEAVDVQAVQTAAFGILNEDAPGLNPNARTLAHTAGRQRIVGRSDQPAASLSIDGNWANVDGKLGVITTAQLSYLDENRYRHCRLREILYANSRDDVGAVPEGTTFSRCTVLALPNASAEHTREQAGMQVQTPSPEITVVRLSGGRILAVNLGERPATASAFGRNLSLQEHECLIVEP